MAVLSPPPPFSLDQTKGGGGALDSPTIYTAGASPESNDHPERTVEEPHDSGPETHDEMGLAGQEEGNIDHGAYTNTTTDDEAEWTDDQGGTFLVRPKRAGESRNQPGQQTTAMRGAIANFRPTPNGEKGGKGKTVLAASDVMRPIINGENAPFLLFPCCQECFPLKRGEKRMDHFLERPTMAKKDNRREKELIGWLPTNKKDGRRRVGGKNPKTIEFGWLIHPIRSLRMEVNVSGS